MSTHALGVALGIVIGVGIVVFGVVPLLWTVRENRRKRGAQRPNTNHHAP